MKLLLLALLACTSLATEVVESSHLELLSVEHETDIPLLDVETYLAQVEAHLLAEESLVVEDPYGGGGGGGGMMKPMSPHSPKPKHSPKKPMMKPAMNTTDHKMGKGGKGGKMGGKKGPAAVTAAPGVGASCTRGTCQDKSVTPCNGGSYVAHLCPGPANVQCCQAAASTPGVGSSCTGGTCYDVNSTPCSGGAFARGLCPGPSNVQCCQKASPPPAGGGSCRAFADSQWNCANPSCSVKVSAGSSQPGYQCAEFVARTLAYTGHVPGLSWNSPQGSFEHYTYKGRQYYLTWTSSKQGGLLGLEDFLVASGWNKGGAITDCSVVFVTTSSPYSHVVVGVGSNLLDAHNNARQHVGPSYYSAINAVYNP